MTFGDPRLPERVWDKISPDPNTGCWLWLAGVDKDGYGKFSFSSKGPHWRVHRLTFETLIGPIPNGLEIDHLCRVRCCANPQHLEPVTSKENTRRSPIHPGSRTHCPKGHPYSAENTGPQRLHTGKIARYCRTCHREADRVQKENRREKKRAAGTYVPARKDRTHCPKGHPYDETNTVLAPNGWRECRTCKNVRVSAYQKAQLTHCPRGHLYETSAYINVAGQRRCSICRDAGVLGGRKRRAP